jgi:phosphoenolpyruvate carboxykinase (ATP)
MVASRPGSPYTGGRPQSSNSVHTKIEEELHEFAGIDYDKVTYSYKTKG